MQSQTSVIPGNVNRKKLKICNHIKIKSFKANSENESSLEVVISCIRMGSYCLIVTEFLFVVMKMFWKQQMVAQQC